MTYPISDVTRRVVYSGSAGTGPYSFSFEILDEGDIAVYENTTLLTIATDYTVTINADGTGSVTLVSASTASDTVAIIGNKGIERQTDFVTGGDLFASSLNDELDAQTIFAQQNAEGLLRSLRAPVTDPTTVNMELPAQADRADMFLSFDASGNPVTLTNAADLQVIEAIADDIETLADIEDGTVATNAISNAAAIDSEITTVAANATAVAAIGKDLIGQPIVIDYGDLSAANNPAYPAGVLGSIYDVLDEIQLVAAVDSDVTTVAGNIDAIVNASDAVVTVVNAVTDSTNAKNDAAKLATNPEDSQYTLSDTTTGYSALHYAAKAEASKVATENLFDQFGDQYLGAKASDPTTDNDGDALNSGDIYWNTTDSVLKFYDGAAWVSPETLASNSATAASNAKDAAVTAQGFAEDAQAAAETAFDSFDDRYLGAKATEPTVDNDGDPLLTGAMYYNSTSSFMYVYDGSTWALAGSAVNGTSERQSYTATAGQTTFAATYDAGFIDVYLNGIKLINGTDFTATNGTSVVLASGATLNDTVDIVAYGTFEVANTYTQTQTDALIANMVETTDIGVSVQAYDATLLNNADIGVSVQAYDADIMTTDNAQVMTAQLTVDEFKETTYSLTGTAIDPANGSIQYKTLSANTTFTESLEDGQSVTLRLEGGATYTVTWPTMTWIGSGGNVAPTLNGTKDVVVIWQENSTVYGAYVGYGA